MFLCRIWWTTEFFHFFPCDLCVLTLSTAVSSWIFTPSHSYYVCMYFFVLLSRINHSINRFDVDCYFKYWKFPQVLRNWNWNLCTVQVSNKLLIGFHFQLKRVSCICNLCEIYIDERNKRKDGMIWQTLNHHIKNSSSFKSKVFDRRLFTRELKPIWIWTSIQHTHKHIWELRHDEDT